MTRKKSRHLAILGGVPVRKAPFISCPMTNQLEKNLVQEVLKKKNFSKYIGATSPTLEMELLLSSEDAARINSNWHYLGGPQVRKFASEFSKKFNCRFSIPVNSATTGLSVALAASGLEPNDEVIVPGLSYTASGTAPLLFQFIPKFVDVDPRSFCIDLNAVQRAITAKTRAIMPVHLLGNMCNMDKLLKIARRHKLIVIEDASQAPGSKWKNKFAGTIGHAGVFSFQQSKNIMTGEGGMIVTNDPFIAKKCRLISNHGEVVMELASSKNELKNIVGSNFRMPEICAAIGIAQLSKIERINSWRNKNATYLINRLKKIAGLVPQKIDKNVSWACHVLSFLFKKEFFGIDRNLFVAALRAEGIPVGTGYTRALYENPIFLKKIAFGSKGYPWFRSQSSVKYKKGQCPVIEKLINEEFLWFYQISYPSCIRDMEDIGAAIEKIVLNIPNIKKYKKEILEKGDAEKRQGRIC